MFEALEVSVLAPSARQDFSNVLAQRSQTPQKCAIATTQSRRHDTRALPRKRSRDLSIPAALESYRLTLISQRHGRGAGVGRGLCVGAGRGVGVCLGVIVAVGV